MMSRRRSSRLGSGLDASFQIPLSVNSTANNLLLDDDALEREFFDGFDLAITTPAHPRPSPAHALSSSNLKSHDEALDFVRSDQENLDYDYAEEEREVELSSGDLEETPRAKRVLGAVVELTLTPRSRKNTSKGSRLATSISSSPVRSEYHLKRREIKDAGSSPICSMPSSRSPSKTPKPDPRRRRTLLSADPIATPTGAPRSTSVLRRNKTPLRSREAAEAKIQHAPSVCSGSALSPGPGVAEKSRIDRITMGRLSNDPHSPEKLLISKSSKLLRSKKPPNSSQRRPSRSRTRGTSPSPLSRVDHNAVMLPIQEEEENLQDKDEQPSISKLDHNADFSVPVDRQRNADVGSTAQREAARASIPRASLSAADSGRRPRPTSYCKPGKRSGDALVPKPALKKRKTEGNIAYLGPTDKHSSLHLDQHSTSTPGPVYADIVVVHDGRDLAMPSANPVAPDSHYRASPSPVIQQSVESTPDLPSGDANVDSGPSESHEQSDEVQDFLLRYAKKYGLGTGMATNPSDAALKKPLPVSSRPISNARTGATTSSKRHNVVPEVAVSEVKRAKVKTAKSAAMPDEKGNNLKKKTSGHPHTKVPLGRTTDKRGPRSVLGTLKVTEKNVPPDRTTDQLGRTSVGPESKSSEAGPGQPLIPPDPPGAFPVDNQCIVGITPRCRDGGNLSEEAVLHRGASSYRDKIAEPRMSSIAEESPADLESPVPLLPSALAESGKMDTAVEPAKAAKVTEASQRGPCAQRPENGYLPLKPPGQSAPTKKQMASESRTDDMFARKQRDNYLQNGLDLTANSSRRHIRRPPPSNMPSDKPFKSVVPVSSIPLERATTHPPPSSAFSSISAAVAGPPGSMVTVLDLTSDAEDQKAEQRATPDLECRYHREGARQTVVQRKGEAAKRNVKEAQIDSFQKRKRNASDRTRSKEQSESILQVEQVTTTVPLSDTISDIVSFGQKLMGSFGLLSSHPDTDIAEPSSNMARLLQSHDVGLDHRVSDKYRGSDIQQATSIPPDNTLLPRQNGRNNDPDCDLINDDHSDCPLPAHRRNSGKTTPSRSGGQNDARNNDFYEPVGTERTGGSGSDVSTDPSHLPQRPLKRSLEANSQKSVTEVDQDVQPRANGRNRKKTRIMDEEVDRAAGQAGSSNLCLTGTSRKVTRKQATSKTSAARDVSKTKQPRAARIRATAHSSEANALDHASNGTDGPRGLKNLCRLTVPLAPTFTTDVLRQQRSSEKPERGQTDRTARPTDVNEGKSIKSVKPTIRPQESWKPTVPDVFRFESDSRTVRKQEFQAKLKSWEERASREASLNCPTSKNKLPDFKSRHAAQEARLAAMTARRREMVAPTVPISPQFMVDSRLAERQKFEEARRAKEAEAERIREEQRRAREEDEVREWREARKRAVPRANAVPKWYSQAPKRTVKSR